MSKRHVDRRVIRTEKPLAVKLSVDDALRILRSLCGGPFSTKTIRDAAGCDPLSALKQAEKEGFVEITCAAGQPYKKGDAILKSRSYHWQLTDDGWLITGGKP